VGWYVHPYVALLVGYKEINVETGGTITGTDTFTNLATGQIFLTTPAFVDTTFSSKIKISGPTLGIAGTVPIAGGFGT
jgi:Na+/glutamate symporter